MQQLGYRFWSGRRGASGFLRIQGGQGVLSGQGLSPGGSYALRALPEGGVLAEGTADAEGRLTLRLDAGREAFLAKEHEVALWENGEEGYLRAAECLRALYSSDAADSFVREASASVPPPAPSLPVEAPAAEALPAQEPPPPRPGGSPGEDAPPPFPLLRPPSASPPVDLPPPLQWPEGAEDVRQAFLVCPPLRVFDDPGWRFVRAPSPIRQAAYCAVGRRVEGDRVTAVAYAVPGAPHRPPVPLPGYRFRAGARGMGYWVICAYF